MPCAAAPMASLVLPDHAYIASVHAAVPDVGAASKYLQVEASVAPQANVPLACT